MGAFDYRTNTTPQTKIIESALAKCDFDFDRMLPGLRAKTGRAAVPVYWRDLTRYRARLSGTANAVAMPRDKGTGHGHSHEHDQYDPRQAALGLAYYNGQIAIEQSIVNNPPLAEVVFLSEAAHMVDFFLLTPEQRHRIYDLFHEPGTPPHDHGWFEETGNTDYWSWVGESWMTGFIWAFTKLRPGWERFRHKLTEDDAREIRAMLGAKVTAPPTPEPTTTPPTPNVAIPDPYFAAKYSYAFHDKDHWWVKVHRTYPTRDAAMATGLRACKVCKP